MMAVKKSKLYTMSFLIMMIIMGGTGCQKEVKEQPEMAAPNYSYTQEKMDELHGILIEAANSPIAPTQQPDGGHDASEEGDMYGQLRGYAGALNTVYAEDVSRIGDADLLSEYFYKDTLQKLLPADGNLDFVQLNFIMELNPDTLMSGDYKALSEVFDELAADIITDEESVNQVNHFLANCYIKRKAKPRHKMDAKRSPVFDKWAEYYLGQEENKTSAADFEILLKSYIGGNFEVNTKFLKQALLQIISSEEALELQLRDTSSSEDSENPRLSVFEIDDLGTGRSGDYLFTMHQSKIGLDDEIEIEYFEFRPSNGWASLFISRIAKEYAKGYKDFAEFTLEWFGLGKKQDSAAVAKKRLAQYDDAKEMEAYQQSGQLMYVNGVRKINNIYIDEEKLQKLETEFQKLIDPNNEDYNSFFPEECDEAARESIEKGLRDPGSAEYKQAYIDWYFSGTGGYMSGREMRDQL